MKSAITTPASKFPCNSSAALMSVLVQFHNCVRSDCGRPITLVMAAEGMYDVHTGTRSTGTPTSGAAVVCLATSLMNGR